MNVLDATKLAAHVAEKNPAMPILACLRIVNGRVLATDLTQQLEIPIDIPGAAKGEAFCVNAARLLKILKSLPDQEALDFSMRDAPHRQLVVVAGDTRFELNVLPPDDFPLIAEESDTLTTIKLPAKTFIEAVQFARAAMAVNDIRYYLNGLLMQTGTGMLTLAATDGHRLHRARIPLENDPDVATQSAIIPAQAIDAVLSVAERHVDLELAFCPRYLQISDTETLHVKCIEGTYPDIARVIPSGRAITGGVPREAMGKRIEQVATILSKADAMGITVRLDGRDGRITLVARSKDGEQATTGLDWAERGDVIPTLDLPLNATYVIDALRSLKGKNVFFHAPASIAESLYLTDDLDDGDQAVQRDCVVMPMRL